MLSMGAWSAVCSWAARSDGISAYSVEPKKLGCRLFSCPGIVAKHSPCGSFIAIVQDQVPLLHLCTPAHMRLLTDAATARVVEYTRPV